MIDTKIGDRYKHLACDKCKGKLIEEAKKLSKVDLLFPRRVIKRYANILCLKCKEKLLKEMRKNAADK